jgi:predicted nuclease of predicted toxin-antitoxin system
MKLLLDQGLPRSSAAVLRDHGIDAVHAGEIGLGTASDQAILGAARVDGRVIVTLDSDFHTILALEESAGPSVIRVRWEGLKGPEVAVLIRQVTELCRDDLHAGAVVSVTPGGLRLRRLPVGRESLRDEVDGP